MGLNEIFFSGQTVNYIIMNFSEDMNEEQLTRVFLTLHNRYLHSLPPGLDKKCMNIICKNLASLSAYHPEFMDADWSGADINSVLLYFSYLIEFRNEHGKECPEIFHQKLKDLRPVLLKFLSEAPLSPAWIDVLIFLFVEQEDDDEEGSPSIIWGFEELLGTIPEHPELYSKFFDLFEELYQDQYYDGFDANNYPRLNQFFITIYMQILDVIFSNPDDPEQKISFSSFGWEKIIDCSIELFTKYFPPEFTVAVFQKCVENLKFIADLDVDEFLSIIEPALSKIPWLIKYNIDFLPLAFNFLEPIIYAIDSQYDTYMGLTDENQSNRLEGYLSDSYYSLFCDLHLPPEVLNQISAQMFEYFKEKLETISDGVIFVISTAPKALIQHLIPDIAQIILQASPVPNSALWFIKKMHGFVGPKNLPGILALCYSSFAQNPSIQALEAISMLSLHLPKLFIDKNAQLMSPLLEWLTKSPPPFIPYIVICLMYIIVHLNPQDQNTTQLLTMINEVIMKGLQASLEEDPMLGFKYLNDFLIVITPLFKKDDENTVDNINFNIGQKHQELAAYFYQIFQQIVEMLQPLWMLQSEQSMSELCGFLKHAIEVGIVTDYQPIIDWLGQALYVSPVNDHISLLETLQDVENTLQCDLIVTEPIMKFLVSFPEIEDTELQRTVYKFIYQRLFLREKHYFGDFFNIDLMMSPLTSPDPRMGNLVFQFIQNIIFSDAYEFDLAKFLTTLVECMFKTFQNESIKDTIIILLKVIENEKCTAQDILGLIASQLTCETPEALRFQEEFHSQPHDPDRITKAAYKMILVYRNQAQAQAQ